MSNATCPPGNELLVFDALSIPSNITTVFIPGSNASNPSMTTCCAPNPVKVSKGCYEWCEVPKSRLHNSSQREIEGDFVTCLSANGLNVSQSSILGVHVATSLAVGKEVSVKGVGVWLLIVAGVWGFGGLF
ncbi:hypothetical protein B0T16DRAFT_460888 [Cercophora newfieldiana]|uniref:Uncharacterized protein n=1 Tax=Cercophora newfieldiana TaxID=92897 RepID=A0AA40CJ21_9PEZI|nr:hypothetical protein B0T16DRAFT_460888 [Cercophora newfieldiana]